MTTSDCEVCGEVIAELTARRDKLLALVARLSQEAALPDEVASALNQLGALLAEVGTLRSGLAAEYQRGRADERVAVVTSCRVEMAHARATSRNARDAKMFGLDMMLDSIADGLEEFASFIEAGRHLPKETK